jgi:hypothetical protein
MHSTPERRCRRSADPLQALDFMLEAARRAEGARAIAVADVSGLLVAGAGAAHACEELAALGAARFGPSDLPLSLYAGEAKQVRLGRSSVVVCIDAEPEASERSLTRVAEGCQRILGRA